ncbi:MAG TPA: DUF1858 domain-containing protein, partial [Candidatus Polarisedimenticolia bacterium]|nr:DUF1858 domain-containing protein [Candidatus Polarisedimenticolia bacterium]
EGAVEPLAWFARVHEVPLPRLLDELNAAARGGAPAAAIPTPSRAERARENLYRRFLKTAILFTLTGGTALGAWALGLMALRGRLGGLDRGVIQVHGHWQLFGWVALFVVGVAYHILPRLTGLPLPSYRAASLSFVALASGTVLRFAQALDPSGWRAALLYGGALLELAGCLLFAWTVARILFAQSGALPPWQRYVGWGTAGLVASALVNAAHARDLAVSGRFEVAAWLNVPYLTIFLVGFVTFWILGVSLRTLPVFMGLETRPRLAGALAAPLAVAVAALAIGEALFLRSGSDAARVLFGAAGIAVAALLVLFTWALGILRPARGAADPGVDRQDEKFLRLGYAWLLIAGLMLGVFSIVTLRGAPLDHAFVGAYRHALTVGFITMLMVGMAQRIVPVFRGVPLWSPRFREWTFWLLAIGNPIRVVGQILSAVAGPAWLRFAGISGVLELTALVLFAVNLWRTMNTETAGERAAMQAPPAIAADTRVGELLDAYPTLLPVFVSSGFAPLANPLLRRTVARGVSVAQACRMHGLALEPFLDRLRRALGPRAA